MAYLSRVCVVQDLSSLLGRVRGDVDRLNAMRKNLGEDGRDTMTIRLSSDNTRNLAEASQLFTQLKELLIKDQRKNKKLSAEEIDNRARMVQVLGDEIKQLTLENQRVKVVTSEEDAAIQQRVESRRKREEDARARREAARRKRGKKGKGEAAEEEEWKDVAAKSEQEQMWETQVYDNMAQQDKILDEISKGLDDLRELAQQANKVRSDRQMRCAGRGRHWVGAVNARLPTLDVACAPCVCLCSN